ncbi:MAG: GntR family transcriptional regulator [Ferroplasma sp.]
MDRNLNIIIDHNSQEPIYKQLYDQIAYSISAGILSEGDFLPPSRTMAGILDINFHTVNEAYSRLRESGIITMAKNRHYMVSSNMNKNAMEKIKPKEKALINEAIAMGIRAEDLRKSFDGIIKAMKNKSNGD